MEISKGISKNSLGYVPKRPPVDIEFQDLTYTVPQGRKGSKMILRSVSGEFKSGQLNAILGPSGSGKSTLLNILAGYKCRGATGSILINGEPRHLKRFRKMSRYIMQDDLIQPMLTVEEAMMVAADLKLNMPKMEKINTITEILELLRLSGSSKTSTNMLSGGETKRLAIALELLNNPPVLFLDEPTTGLDDMSSTQCIHLLKQIAEGGRTVICSIHTPSAKLFSVFDNVYIIAAGQCVYQGYGPEVVPFLSNLGIECPKHYNPADFIIEVCCMEYGDYHERMVTAVDNGRANCSSKCIPVASMDEISLDNSISLIKEDPVLSEENFNHHQSGWMRQFYILVMRMWLQMWRDKCYLLLRVCLYLAVGILIGNLYIGMGQDGSKTIFNFGFYFTCLIFFMYIPMMPILSQFPREVQLLKREHFNKWYRLSAYFAALTVSTIPVQVILGTVYVLLVYTLSDQPMEIDRLLMFYLVCMLTGIVSESLGLLIASQLTIVNAVFVGPVLTVPFMLLAVYGFGSGYDTIPTLIKIAMYFSYLRYSLEGLIHSMLKDRQKLDCPESEEYCIYTDLNYFIKEMGMENTIYWLDIAALIFILVLFRGGSYYLLRQRLSPNKTFLALQYIGRFLKSHMGMTR
ncbi:hypothetical protein NQ315_007792 [Exocentrus adspersus]|uniref:ABC transporter domain-containing protein n=1 Tax=Exocentrus adspersus TaxID=1586481 RepID=A0AAV8W7Z0_9CUCU|nr:hypothetical protein NQ315_007792 [Exocentrus adspersus]